MLRDYRDEELRWTVYSMVPLVAVTVYLNLHQQSPLLIGVTVTRGFGPGLPRATRTGLR